MHIKKFLEKENNNLDLIRVFCASLVIIGHSYRLDHVGKIDIIENFTGFTYSGELAVIIFFFISGMLVTHSLLKKKSIKSFLISRLFRIVPGLFFLLIISAFLIGPLVSSTPTNQYFRDEITYLYVIKNIFFQSTYILPGVFNNNDYKNAVNGSLWSIRYEVACYLILLAIFCGCFFTIQKYKLVYNCIIIGSFFSLISVIFINEILNIQILTTSVLEHSLILLSFALGVFLAANQERIVIRYRYFFISSFFTAVFWHFNIINNLLFNTSCCFLVILIAQNKFIKKIKIKHDISYGIYLWGFLIQQIVFYLVGRQNIYLFMIISLLISYLVGTISFLLVEKRFMDWGHSIQKNK